MNATGFYLLLYFIALRILSLSSINEYDIVTVFTHVLVSSMCDSFKSDI